MGSPIVFAGNFAKLLSASGLMRKNGSLCTSDGPKNYITYGNFENGLTTGWSGTGCASLTNGLPTSVGSGAAAFSNSNGGRALGANTSAPAIDSTSAISGTNAINLATTGAGTIGDGYISQAYTIDKSDQAQVLGIRFKYKSVTGAPVMAGTSANTYACAIYDMVNNAWIIPAGAFNFVQSSGVGTFTGTFQTNSNTVGIQLFVYSPVAPVGASSLYLDDFYVGPQSMAFGPPVTDWTAYTATTQGLGTTSAQETEWRRVGDSLEVRGKFTTGTVTASEARIGFPTGLTSADSSKIPSLRLAGQLERDANITYHVLPLLMQSGVTYFNIGTALAGGTAVNSGQFTAQNGSTVLNSSQAHQFFAKVPIQGWSSSTVLSQDSDTRVCDFYTNGNAPTGTINSGYNIAIFGANTVVKDSHAIWNASTGRGTIAVTGDYQISGVLEVTCTPTTSGYVAANVFKNGVGTQISGGVRTVNTTTTSFPAVFSGIISLVAGDIVDVRSITTGSSASYSSSVTGSNLSINRLSGPAVIAASESVNARYYSSVTALSGSLATILYATKSWDTHGAYNPVTGIFTAPVSGKYQFNASMATSGTFALNSLLDMQVQQAGSASQITEAKDYAGGNVTALSAQCGDIFYLLAGDTIKVQASSSATTPTIVASNSQNWISIARVGN